LQRTSEEVLSNMVDDLVDVSLENIFDSFLVTEVAGELSCLLGMTAQ